MTVSNRNSGFKSGRELLEPQALADAININSLARTITGNWYSCGFLLEKWNCGADKQLVDRGETIGSGNSVG